MSFSVTRRTASVTRRTALAASLGSAAGLFAAAPPVLIETHVHLFDPARVPYAPDAPYRPPPYPLEAHLRVVREAGLSHSVIVHPEPYQDDHRYLEYALAHEPRAGYFKGVCLFDPLRADTPGRVRALQGRWPGRMVAMRIHETSMTPEASGPIRNRDMNDPRMLECWKALAAMRVGIQMHFIPAQAANIRKLAEKVPETTVILDHMGRPGDGTEAEYAEVLRLAELPRVILKYSGWDMYKGDLAEITRRIYDAFGPDRMVWGMLGNTMEQFQKQSARFQQLLAFTSAADRARIAGGTAARLFFGETVR
jgi:predicted TIM-barrel fold metal-dependent hydrolase